jgi:DNA-directed RNA polymerase specialized sigma24 family protein
MDDRDWLAQRFEENRTHLRSVAYRMLGSLSEAEDALQEAWLHLSRSEKSSVENLRDGSLRSQRECAWTAALTLSGSYSGIHKG